MQSTRNANKQSKVSMTGGGYERTVTQHYIPKEKRNYFVYWVESQTPQKSGKKRSLLSNMATKRKTFFGWHTQRKGEFLIRDNRVCNGPVSRSLRTFARTTHSAYSLRFVPLQSRARSLTTLTLSWDSWNLSVHAVNAFYRSKHVFHLHQRHALKKTEVPQ